MKTLKTILYVLYLLLVILIGVLIFKISNILYVHDIKVDGMSVDTINYHIYEVGYLHADKDVVISDYDEFVEYFNENTNFIYDSYGNIVKRTTSEIINNYDESFFNNRNLCVMYVPTPGGDAKVMVSKLRVTNKILKVSYYIEDNSNIDVMNGYFIIAEVDKKVNKIKRGN